jgi:F-type H+-transporting ATPase subunit a
MARVPASFLRLWAPGALAALLALGPATAGAAEPADEHHPAGQPTKAPAAAGKKLEIPPAMEHVQDDTHIHISDQEWGHLSLPKIFGFQITRFMVFEVIAAGLIVLIYVPMARRLQRGDPPRGAWDNAFESLLTFVRDQIARPSLGEEIADRYVPFLWTLFLFILFNNLLGIVPFMGSPTASIIVTGVLALIVFFALHGSAIIEMGRGHGHDGHGEHGGNGEHAAEGHAHAAEASTVVLFFRGLGRYAKAQWPQIDLPGPMGWVIKPLVCGLELMGVLVRNAVLAVRLFANMFAGHMVLATILFFIQTAANLSLFLWAGITVASIGGILALSLLELFVAFLQAYIFTFLTALFMGMAIHPSH